MFGFQQIPLTTKYCCGKVFDFKGRNKMILLNTRWYPVGKYKNKLSLSRIHSSTEELPSTPNENVKNHRFELGARSVEDGSAVVDNDAGFPPKAIDSSASAVIHRESHMSIIKLVGEGSLNFLHGQSTNSFTELKAGKNCLTVFTDRSGRMIDLAQCLVTQSGVLMIVSENAKDRLYAQLNKHIFRGDNVEISDVTNSCSILRLLGPKADDVIDSLKFEDRKSLSAGEHKIIGFLNAPIFVSRGDGHSDDKGYTFVVDKSVSGDFYFNLVGLGAMPMSDREWECMRIKAGYPKNGAEITDSYNPFEACLYSAVSLDKGCYLGQEALSKIYAKKALLHTLIAFTFKSKNNNSVVVGDKIYLANSKRPGIVTSVCTDDEGQGYGLGYIKRKDTNLTREPDILIGELGMKGKIIDVPYLKEFSARDLLKVEKIETTKMEESKEEKMQEMKMRMEEYIKNKKREI